MIQKKTELKRKPAIKRKAAPKKETLEQMIKRLSIDSTETVAPPVKKRVAFKQTPEKFETYSKQEYDRRPGKMMLLTPGNIAQAKKDVNKVMKEVPIHKKSKKNTKKFK